MNIDLFINTAGAAIVAPDNKYGFLTNNRPLQNLILDAKQPEKKISFK
ncbi:hypothetical protein [Dysgonomonas sp. PF1-23]|nr:hypothetical protein [Dysgonomonas sp. PF1-23]